MRSLTTTTVAIAIEHAQEGAQVGREAVERDLVLRELHRLLKILDVRNCPTLHLVSSSNPPIGS